MNRLIALSLAVAVLFVGFAIPFLVPGTRGLLAGAVVVTFGAGLFWFVESRTRASLDKDTSWNRLLKADGEDLVERDKVE